MAEQPTFFTKAINHLYDLKTEQKPEWGEMTPQHMVEHVAETWRISNGKASVEQEIPDEDIEKQLEFLRNDVPFPKDIQNPTHSEGLPPLKKNDLSNAIQQLEQEILDFDIYFDKNPNAQPVHPVFGPIDRIDWLRFQEKHMLHHLRQFNLM